MKNLPASNKTGSTSANYKKVTIRRSFMAGVIALALLTSLTGMRPLTNGQERAETGVKVETGLTGAKTVKKRLSVAEAKAMSRGRFTDAEAAAFANFINTAADEDICWKNTKTRGIGTIGTECPPGTVEEGLFCYKRCPAGYSTSPGGLICGKDCPAGWITTPLTCFTNADTVPKPSKPCPPGWRDDGTACWLDLDIYWNDCTGNCRPGYNNDGCTCRRNVERQGKEFLPCPAGYTIDSGLLCTKPVQSMNRDLVPRGEVKTRACGPGKEQQAGLCYDLCPQGTKGVGPVCWSDCNSSFPVNCGAACAKTKAQCALAVIKMVVASGDFALNVAGLVSGAGAAKAAIQAGIKAAVKHALTASGRRILLQKAKTTLITQARKNGKEIAEELLNKSAEAMVGSYEKGEFDWTVLDPTGIAAVVEAFNKPICGT